MTGEEIDIGEGKVGQAVRASCTIPAVFEPVSIDDRLLVDGGLVNRLPVDVVQRMGADIVVGSDVSCLARVGPAPRNIIDTILISLSLLGDEKTRIHRRMADFMIYPEMVEPSAWSFARWRESIEAGQEAARQVIPAIKEEIKRRSRWWRFTKVRRRKAADCKR